MHLGLRLLFGFFVIVGLAAYFVLRVFLAEVQPSVREVTEDILVDAAHLLAETAAPELAALGAGATLEHGAFAAAVQRYRARPVDAQIWGLHKRSLDFRVYVTDAAGRVVFDGGAVPEVGADYSRWRDVARTLRGEYGARATREVLHDERSSVLYVAAPVRDGERLVGVLTVAKPVRTIQQFVDRAERRILVAGAWLLALSLAVGIAVTLWTVHSVRRLRRYAQQARAGAAQPAPALPGELGELARAMAAMRERLEDRGHVEQAMRALTHELKSPLTAIGGAAELLGEALPPADRAVFAQQIGEQVQRLRALVDRLRLAVSNLLANALAFAPAGSTLDLSLAAGPREISFTLRDRGPGVADYALPQLGQRFFSTPRPDGAKGSGLGLAIVRQVVQLHGGRLRFEPAAPGLRVVLSLPRRG